MKGRLAPFVLACFATLLCIWPLTLQSPGLPLGLKADEAAYFLMARSLWEDHDLVCEKRDLVRIADDFVNDADNLILMTPDNGGISYYAKPYFGSLLAAPFVAAFGPRGFITFNMMLLLAATLLGWFYLRERNEEAEALFFAVSYFFISVSWEYVYWLQPETFCLFCVSGTLFCTMASGGTPPGQARESWYSRVFLGDRTRWLWAGLLIGPAANAKPVYLAALLPGIVAGLVAPSFKQKVRVLLLLGLATGVSVLGVAAGQKALTGTWSPYMGLKRQGVNVRNPYTLWVSQAKAAGVPVEPAAATEESGAMEVVAGADGASSPGTSPTPVSLTAGGTPGTEGAPGLARPSPVSASTPAAGSLDAAATSAGQPGRAASPSPGAAAAGTDAGAPTASPLPTEPPCKEEVYGTYWWVFKWPGIQWQRVGLDIRNYLIGRHTGAFIWFPFLLVGVLYFLVGGGIRSPQRWGALVGLVLFAAWFLIWNYHNYHGGGGFIGNRYLVGMYPVGLYVIDRLRPRALQLLGFVLGGLFLGQVLFAPLGPLVEEGTLQVYARAVPFRWLPFEFTLPRQIPGYRGLGQEHASLDGRKDQVRQNAEWLRILGNAPTQVFLSRHVGARTAAFLVKSWAPGNAVKMSLGRKSVVVHFPEGDPPPGGSISEAVLPMSEPDEIFQEFARNEDKCAGFPGSPFEGKWYLTVEPKHAVRPVWFGAEKDDALVGAEILYVGEAERLTRNVFSARMYDVEMPASVSVGAQLEVPLTIANTSDAEWSNDSPVRVNLSYRILDPKNEDVIEVGIRTRLPELVRRGESVRVPLRLVAPGATGDYILAVEPVYEYVNWFAAVNPASVLHIPLHVVSRSASATAP